MSASATPVGHKKRCYLLVSSNDAKDQQLKYGLQWNILSRKQCSTMSRDSSV